MARVHKDKGYAWVVCGASFISQLVQCAVFHSGGMFFIVLKENIGGSSSEIALIPSITSATAFITAPLAGILFSKFGGRKVGVLGAVLGTFGLILASRASEIYQFYLTLGIMTGMGLAFQYNPCVSMLTVYFNKRLGVAMGIASAGCGIGSTLFPLFIQKLKEFYGWRGALLLCGATQLQSILCAALYRPVEEEEASQDANMKAMALLEKQNSDAGIIQTDEVGKGIYPNVNGTNSTSCLKTGICRYLSHLYSPVYILFCLSQFSFMTAMYIVSTHLGAYAMSLGCTADEATVLFFVIGIVTTVSRFLSGAVAQFHHLIPLGLCTLATILLGLTTTTLGYFKTYQSLIAYAALFGLLTAPLNTLFVNVIADIMPRELHSMAIGFLLVFFVPGCLSGAPIAGYLYDTTGIYQSSFYLSSSLMFVSGLFSGAAGLCHHAQLKLFKSFPGKQEDDKTIDTV